ncbi:hypothetical protein [Halorientalis regularis]|nr:hypothetical protein [Halorientalis regularis]
MRRNLFTLVAVTLLAVGASGVVAATLDAPSADTQSADALPANHTVDVINPGDVSDDAVDRAVETAWADDEVRSYSGSEAKAHPFTGGMKPTTGNLSTLVGTVGVGCLRNIFR